MFNWMRRLLKVSPSSALAPNPEPVQQQGAAPIKTTTTWQERAAAVGALIEPGQKPSYTPIGLTTGKPKPARTRRGADASNPLQLRGKALAAFLGRPGGIERYEAAERQRKALGSVGGRHYTQYVPKVKALLQSKDYGPAVALLQRLVAAADAEAAFSGHAKPSWYLSQLLHAQSKLKKH